MKKMRLFPVFPIRKIPFSILTALLLTWISAWPWAANGEELERPIVFRLDTETGPARDFPKTVTLMSVVINNEIFVDEVEIRGAMDDEAFSVTLPLSLKARAGESLEVFVVMPLDRVIKRSIDEIMARRLILHFRTDRTGTYTDGYDLAAEYIYSEDSFHKAPEKTVFSYRRAH
jgi:hypothetical protein